MQLSKIHILKFDLISFEAIVRIKCDLRRGELDFETFSLILEIFCRA